MKDSKEDMRNNIPFKKDVADYRGKLRRSDISPVLIEELAGGNHAAYEDIYFRYRKNIKNFLLSFVRDDDIADDITQEVFITLWENRTKLEPQKGVLSYLFRIAQNKMLKHMEHRKVRENFLQFKRWETHDSVSSDDALLLQEADTLIHAIISRMPEKRRQVFELSRFEGRSIEEIALLLNISQDNVRKHLRLAIKDIRELISAVAILFILP